MNDKLMGMLTGFCFIYTFLGLYCYSTNNGGGWSWKQNLLAAFVAGPIIWVWYIFSRVIFNGFFYTLEQLEKFFHKIWYKLE